MTNTELLRHKIEECRITVTLLAEKAGMTRESLYNKMNNVTEFKASEISAISGVLELTNAERDQIFFDVM